MVDLVLYIIIGFLGVALAVLPLVLPSENPWVRWGLVICGAAILICIVLQGIRDFKTRSKSEKDQQELRDQIKSLLKPSVGASPDDIKSLHDEMARSFEHLEDLVRGRNVAAVPRVEPPPPAVIEHLRFTQRRIASTSEDAPFALQVVIQTDIASQPTGLAIECDGEITEGNFFVAGQGVSLNVRYGISGDRRAFLLSFAFPPFTPESPIVATILSKANVKVIGIRKWQP